MCGVQHSSATDIPFKHYTAEIRRKPPAHPRRILGCCILTIGEPVITMLNQSCGVSAEKKTKNKTEQYARVFRCCDEYPTLFDPQKLGSAHVIHLVIISLLYLQEKKKDILYMGFHIDNGLGFIRVLTWAERDLFRPSSW